jgi:hypothetical protein
MFDSGTFVLYLLHFAMRCQPLCMIPVDLTRRVEYGGYCLYLQ